MPYIPKEQRAKIDAAISLVIDSVKDHGKLNYAITKIIHEYTKREVDQLGMSYLFGGPRSTYDVYNGAIGVLECAKQEFLRTVVGPYEEKKRLENGDI